MVRELTMLNCLGEEREEMKESKESASVNARDDGMSDAGLRAADGRGECLTVA